MASEPIDDIEAWSKKLSMWRQDCLRRLAVSNELAEDDLNALMALVKHTAGFKLDTPPPKPVPFVKSHFGGGKQQPVVLKSITNVENVNRLVPKATLNFCPKSLTVIYGRNGSGKSGFVRILRTACRTRVENANKLRVLGDVYAGAGGPQTAEIIVDIGSGDISIPWAAGKSAARELMQIAVFDTLSAQLYVDAGNRISFLPFGLALPHRLNSVCLELRRRLDAERATIIGDKISLTTIAFPVQRASAPQVFDASLAKETTDAEINEATHFNEDDQIRLDQVAGILSAGTTAVIDLIALATWVELVAGECEIAATELSDAALTGLAAMRTKAMAARQATQLAATALFTDEPLQGVGTETWRALWLAARDYSVNEAYVGEIFPVTSIEEGTAACVLCQQPLLADGVARMHRFIKYMDDTLDLAAELAEQAVRTAASGIAELTLLRAPDFSDRLEQVRRRDLKLAQALSAFRASAIERRANAAAILNGGEIKSLSVLPSIQTDVKALALKLKAEKDALNQASDAQERDKLIAEKAELEDRKILAANRGRLITRRDLLIIDASYVKALAAVHPKGITQRANELVDTHLTSSVAKRFNAERARLDIMHLQIALLRKSNQILAEFGIDPQTPLTKLASEILSEGEQRALALAGFLTEVAMTDGSGPIIVDDPVSSLDRDRSSSVAERLAEEARQRQVVVFTHDMVFFNELCSAAEKQGIEPVTIGLFGDRAAAGKVDPAGMVWKGLNVGKRLKRIKSDFPSLAKLHATSPAEYEYQVKNLYGRLRDTYERVVEEVIFQDVVRRGTDVIQTQRLRCVTLSHPLAIRFHEGMSKANTHSHDNPASDTVAVPTPTLVEEDVASLERLIVELRAEAANAEAARPQMKLKT